jgi:ATP-dependent RNA helicase RhlE
MTFSELGLIQPILQNIQNEGYETPTPIQAQAIPHVLSGRDLFGSASTGTGKTAAFSLPMLHILAAEQPKGRRMVRALVLAPTRELALQISESVHVYGKGLGLRHTAIFGGVSQRPQTDALRNGVDILVATPGRLKDLINQGYIDLGHVQVFILDEADRMLDMGFIHDIRQIMTMLPTQRQTLLFSATLPPEMRSLVNSVLKDPVHVSVAPVKEHQGKLDEQLFHVDRNLKASLLVTLLRQPELESVLVFTRTKHGADKLTKTLRRNGVKADAIHGNKSQSARQSALNALKDRRIQALIATDVASRGIDVDFLSHVVNYDLPETPETYTHRIGRTARAGNSGLAISFCGHDEVRLLKDIERYMRRSVPVGTLPALVDLVAAPAPGTEPMEEPRQFQGGGRNQRPQQPRSDRPARPRGMYGQRSERTDRAPATAPGTPRNDRQQPQGQRPWTNRERNHEPRKEHAASETAQFFSNIGWDAPKFDRATQGERTESGQPRGQQATGAPRNDHNKRKFKPKGNWKQNNGGR